MTSGRAYISFHGVEGASKGYKVLRLVKLYVIACVCGVLCNEMKHQAYSSILLCHMCKETYRHFLVAKEGAAVCSIMRSYYCMHRH